MNGIRVFLAAAAATALSGTALAQTAPTIPTAQEEPSAEMLAGVAAIVNDEVISISDVGQRARLMLITLGVPATEDNMRQIMPNALEELIDERLQLQKAAEYELVVSEDDVLAAVRDIAAQNQSTVDQLYETLRAQGVNPATLEDQMRAEIAWRRIMSGLYASRIRISPLQIDSMLERMSASASEERYQLSEIFLYAPTEADKQQALQGASIIVEQIRQGARFELAARQYSNSPTVAVGGDLGWVSPAELDPEVQNFLETIEPPALTSPIVVDDGVYVYAFRGKQDGSQGPDEVDLRQVLSMDGDVSALNRLNLDQPSCDTLQESAEELDLVYAEIGRVSEQSLSQDIRNAISNVPTGGSTEVIESQAGPAVLFVCDRGQGGLELPSRAQVEDRLFSQQISMLSQRDLRDIRREATIIRR